MSKQPFLPLFFGDFLSATMEWRGEEASLYLTLLGYQWAAGSLPKEPADLSRLVRWDRKLFDRCWLRVAAKFEERDGRLYNSRLEEHREKSKQLSSKRQAIGSIGGQQSAAKRQAIGQAELNHPSHPIPSHEEEALLSPSSGDLSPSEFLGAPRTIKNRKQEVAKLVAAVADEKRM